MTEKRPLSYGQPRTSPEARRWSRTDRRYSSYRWREKTRLPVLRREQYRCWVAGCDRLGDVADHIDRVTPETTDAQFFDQARIRASCRAHNLARALLSDEELAPPRQSSSFVVTSDYSRRPMKPRIY